jgi:hypothetical protein
LACCGESAVATNDKASWLPVVSRREAADNSERQRECEEEQRSVVVCGIVQMLIRKV